MSDPVDEAVRKLAEKQAAEQMRALDDLCPDSGEPTAPFNEDDLARAAERVLTEQLAPLLRAGQTMRKNHRK